MLILELFGVGGAVPLKGISNSSFFMYIGKPVFKHVSSLILFSRYYPKHMIPLSTT